MPFFYGKMIGPGGAASGYGIDRPVKAPYSRSHLSLNWAYVAITADVCFVLFTVSCCMQTTSVQRAKHITLNVTQKVVQHTDCNLLTRVPFE